jgi:hypothetical protein
MLSGFQNDKIATSKPSTQIRRGRISACILSLKIPICYGIENENARFFGQEFLNDYHYRIDHNTIYDTGDSNTSCPDNSLNFVLEKIE